jgi:hypothetical protein
MAEGHPPSPMREGVPIAWEIADHLIPQMRNRDDAIGLGITLSKK